MIFSDRLKKTNLIKVATYPMENRFYNICNFEIVNRAYTKNTTTQILKPGYSIILFSICILKVLNNLSIHFLERGPPAFTF